MTSHYVRDFGSFDGRIWLNCAHQGPFPRIAVEAAQKALAMKISPHLISEDSFQLVPQQMKSALGHLLGLPADEIILSNSTSYGLHLLANGFPWKKGDEILLVKGDFPASILPWLRLKDRGVDIRFIESKSQIPTAGEVEAHLNEKTQLFCTSWVNSFSGSAVDAAAIGQVCRSNGVFFALNGSQAVGVRVFSHETHAVDMLTSCGSKWLCGPYATGFCWMRTKLLALLDYNQAYWLAMQKGRSLNKMRECTLRDDLGAGAFDVFGTANFFNFMPWAASVEYLHHQGINRIVEHNESLVSRFVQGVDLDKYNLISPENGPARSTLIVLAHKNPEHNSAVFNGLKRKGIDISMREGNLRISPHLYNTSDDIDHLLSALSSF